MINSTNASSMEGNGILHKEYLDILLVDDDEIYLKILSRLLTKDQKYSYRVTTEKCAEKAIDTCRTQLFDIILLDCNLPGMSGIDCLHKIRSESTCLEESPPAIICTAEGSEAVATEALHANAEDYLPKRHINANSISRSIDNVVTKHRLKRSVEAQVIQLQRINQQLEQKSVEISNFYQTVSHEVKTPLAAAREFISLVNDGVSGPVSPQQIELLEHALSSCDQLARHFNDLVDITRLSLDKLQVSITSFPVESLVARSVASCAEALRRQRGELSVKNTATGTYMEADMDRVNQVLSNLIGNAVKYSKNKPKIEVSVDTHDNYPGTLLFSVKDNGCGINTEEQEYVFNKLYQTNRSNDQCLGAGIGLGLSIAKEIVEIHQGRIWLESTVGIGSQFYFTIPVKYNAPEHSARKIRTITHVENTTG